MNKNTIAKNQIKESGKDFEKVGKNIGGIVGNSIGAIANTIGGTYKAIDAGDLAIHSRLGKSSNKVLDLIKRNILKILIVASILTHSGTKIYQNQQNKSPNKIELSESDENKIDLKLFDYKIKTPEGLKGRKVGDLYSHYLGYNGKSGEILDTIIFKPNEIVEELYLRKFKRKKDTGFTVAKDFYDNTISKLDFDLVKPSSLDLMTGNIKSIITVINKNFDRDKFGEDKLKGDKEKIKLFKEICGQIDEKCLLAYGMTELMPSAEGNLNKEILDFLLNNGGENLVMNLPAIADDYISFGLYQFTSFAVYDTGKKQKGASIMNLYLPKDLKIPGSITKLQGNDHHKAAYLFAMCNLYTLISKADGEIMKALKFLIDQKDNNNLTQLIAIMHNYPANGKIFLKEWYKLNTNKKYLNKKQGTEKNKYNYDLNNNNKIDLYESFIGKNNTPTNWSHNYGKKTFFNKNAL